MFNGKPLGKELFKRALNETEVGLVPPKGTCFVNWRC